MTTKSTIQQISITRLFSTGQFEHQKISLNAEILPGMKPGDTLKEMESILDDLNPKPPYTEWEMQHARKLATPEAREASNIEFAADWEIQDATQKLADYDAWQTRRQSALDRLNSLPAIAIL
jgi:hypothetical protein